MKYFSGIIVCLGFIGISAIAWSNSVNHTSKNTIQKSTKHTWPEKQMQPPTGLYEIKAISNSWGHGPNDVTVEREVPCSFKWLRLFSNGTFKTNLISGKTIVGTYSYQPKSNEIIWSTKARKQKFFDTKEHAQIETNKKEHVISWRCDYVMLGNDLYGKIRAHWARP